MSTRCIIVAIGASTLILLLLLLISERFRSSDDKTSSPGSGEADRKIEIHGSMKSEQASSFKYILALSESREEDENATTIVEMESVLRNLYVKEEVIDKAVKAAEAGLLNPRMIIDAALQAQKAAIKASAKPMVSDSFTDTSVRAENQTRIECKAGEFAKQDISIVRSWRCSPCPPKSWSPENSKVCQPCPHHAYCPARSAAPSAKRGYWWNREHDLVVPCKRGTYNPFVGGISADDCRQCPSAARCAEAASAPIAAAGYFWSAASLQVLPCRNGTFKSGSDPNNNTESACRKCPAHAVCSAGSETPVPVRGYFWDPLRFQIFLCPVGTYAPQQGVTSQGDCIPCPDAAICEGGEALPVRKSLAADNMKGFGALNDTGEISASCEAGHFKGNISHINCSVCPPNTWSNEASDICTSCPVNSISPSGSVTASACGAAEGFYGMPGDVMKPCPGHSVCPSGSIIPRADGGFYWDLVSASVRGCKAGSFSRMGETSCSPCPAHTWSPPKASSCLSHVDTVNFPYHSDCGSVIRAVEAAEEADLSAKAAAARRRSGDGTVLKRIGPLPGLRIDEMRRLIKALKVNEYIPGGRVQTYDGSWLKVLGLVPKRHTRGRDDGDVTVYDLPSSAWTLTGHAAPFPTAHGAASPATTMELHHGR